ncbi:MAG: Tim44 protein [Herbaspirillum sp.]|jgi:predicted lipid-binding transport protein (Tim44 family)|nr:Tim44 protein [Herbaspirillum sp.]
MKRLLIALLIFVTMLPLAEARRLGGGGSIGRQSTYSRQVSPPSQTVTPARPAAPAAAPAAAPGAVTPPRPASPWRGILGGALLGLGLGALLSHFGIGGAFGSMISMILMLALLGFAVMFLVRMFSRRNNAGDRPANEPAYAGRMYSEPASGSTSFTPEIGSGIAAEAPRAFQTPSSGLSSGSFGGGAGGHGTALGIPADFDVAGFVRNAKTYFIRLQAAGDKADIHDIREFTTPEMFAELRLQIQERGASPNVTDVVQLNGELLGIDQEADDYLATVKFSGLIKEAPDASAEPFAEMWIFSKPVDGGGWVLAGIQQVS